MTRALLVIALGLCSGAMAQAPVVNDPFVAINTSLSTAADRVLSRGSGQQNLVAAKQTPVLSSEAPSFSGMAGTRWSQLRNRIEPILKAEGIPLGVLAVVRVESGGNPDALSPAGARGLWQLMPETARRYGLKVSHTMDERVHLEKSTTAAARYLRDLHAQFGDWRLAFAAYNAGERRVSRALARSSSGEFDVLSQNRLLPEETRRYVPAVMAAMQDIEGRSSQSRQIRPLVRTGFQVYAQTSSSE